MARPNVPILFAVLLSAAALPAAAQSGATGTIRGHVKLTGKIPGNPVIRMRTDPMCARITRGQQLVQETVVATADGSLANVFVHLEGTFPAKAAPSTPVVVDQKNCLYSPRVVGVQVGQPLKVVNNDPLLHNVHGLSGKDNSFNVAQPIQGMMNEFHVKNPEVMIHLTCDVHGWMNAYIGVVPHPYFAVTDAKGNFEIRNVPAGRQTIQIWHELYGPLTQTVTVRAGATTTADFSYTGAEKPRAAVRELRLPGGDPGHAEVALVFASDH